MTEMLAVVGSVLACFTLFALVFAWVLTRVIQKWF